MFQAMIENSDQPTRVNKKAARTKKVRGNSILPRTLRRRRSRSPRRASLIIKDGGRRSLKVTGLKEIQKFAIKGSSTIARIRKNVGSNNR